MTPGEEIALRIDQTLTQDATGTLVMLQLEAMRLERAQTEISVQYVDHNLIQEDYKNADDHLFLYSAARRFGLWYSAPGNGVSHPLHQERFGKPGRTLLGSDSHTPASALTGVITDPRTLDQKPPRVIEPDDLILHTDMFEPPLDPDEAKQVELEKGPNIVTLPDFDELPNELTLPVLLKVDDDISTDEILPAGSRVLPFRSNIPEISRF